MANNQVMTWEKEQGFADISEDCQIILTAAPHTEEDFDVLLGENLEAYFETPVYDRERTIDLALNVYDARRNSEEAEDAIVCHHALKLINYIEYSSRTEFSFGEIRARLCL